MDVPRVAVTTMLLGILAAGCTADPRPDAASPTGTTTASLMVERPHFEGSLPVALEAGTPVYGDTACSPDADRSRICSADGSAMWFTYPGTDVHLVEAEMAPTDDSTAWVVILTFDSQTPVAVSRQALGLGADLLVVSRDDEVIVAHRPVTVPTHSVHGRRVRLEETDKATAWDLVSALVETL